MGVTAEQQEVLHKVRSAAADVRSFYHSLAAADAVLRERVREAISNGCSVGDIARESALSRSRIYQIRDGRR